MRRARIGREEAGAELVCHLLFGGQWDALNKGLGGVTSASHRRCQEALVSRFEIVEWKDHSFSIVGRIKRFEDLIPESLNAIVSGKAGVVKIVKVR